MPGQWHTLSGPWPFCCSPPAQGFCELPSFLRNVAIDASAGRGDSVVVVVDTGVQLCLPALLVLDLDVPFLFYSGLQLGWPNMP